VTSERIGFSLDPIKLFLDRTYLASGFVFIIRNIEHSRKSVVGQFE
jgi:hypothetical protein